MTSILIRDLPDNISEKALLSTFDARKDKLVAVKLARDLENPDVCLGYGYIEFESAKYAQLAMSRYNGVRIVGHSHRLNMSVVEDDGGGSVSCDSCQIYVGNLSEDISEGDIYQAFKQLSSDVCHAILARAPNGSSFGYGFIKCSTDDAARKCIATASIKNVILGRFPVVIREAYRRTRVEIERGVDYVTNTTIFVGNLPGNVLDESLRQLFSCFGPIESTRIVNQRGFGFVTFVYHVSALGALSHMQSVEMDGSIIHCMWGRMRPFGVDGSAEEQYRTSGEQHNEAWSSCLIPLRSDRSLFELPVSKARQDLRPSRIHVSSETKYVDYIVQSWILLDSFKN